jgi:alcohol dehydrogenase class IV
MNNFIFHTTPHIVFGNKSLNTLTEELIKLNISSAFFISDPYIAKTEFFNNILIKLAEKKIKTNIYSNIKSDPDFENVDETRDKIIKANPEIIIGIGGGSTMDIAKLAAITAKTGENARDVAKSGIVSKNKYRIILIPTTAGTGSEVTHISIFSDNMDMVKTGIVHPNLYANIAILDPEITLELPQTITAFSGIDALIHALESLTSKSATRFSELLAEEALKTIYDNIVRAFDNGKDIEARSNMLYGSMLAGIAFANSSVAAIHAFAYPIGAKFHIPHGLANSIMLMPVLKFNLENGLGKYSIVAKALGIETKGKTEHEITERLILKLDNLVDKLEINRKLKNYGVHQSDIAELAKSVIKITRLLSNNPREINIRDAERLYSEAL